MTYQMPYQSSAPFEIPISIQGEWFVLFEAENSAASMSDLEVRSGGTAFRIYRAPEWPQYILALPPEGFVPPADGKLPLSVSLIKNSAAFGAKKSGAEQPAFAFAKIQVLPARGMFSVKWASKARIAEAKRVKGKPAWAPEDFPFSHFDGMAYLAANPAVRPEILSGKWASALEHFLGEGRAKGLVLPVSLGGHPNIGNPLDWWKEDQGKLKEAQGKFQEENELLLFQLHQVQEELEQYFLKNKDLESEKNALSTDKQALKARLSTFVSEKNAIAKDRDRILFVIPSPRSGATGRYTQVLAEELVRLGAAVMVLADGAAPRVENGVPWEPIKFEGAFLSTALRRRISLFQPNIVYENGVRSRSQRAALEAVYLTGARFAMQSEDDDVQMHSFRHGEKAVEGLTILDKTPLQPSEIARFLGNLDWGHSLNVLKNPAYDRWVEPMLRAACYHLAEAHTAIWHPIGKRLETQYGKPTLVVPPVCGEEYFSLEPLQESQRGEILGGFQIPADRTVFFVAGAIYPYSEEFRAFLSAMRMAAKHSTSPLCVVVSGRGWKEAGRIAEEELSTKILFRNLEEPDDARYLEILRAADVACSPGVCDDFTRYRLPSRLVKAMAMGKPILTANWGFGESLRNGVDAFLTEGNNPEDWTKTILNAMDARKREEVGRNGKKFADENFRAGPVSGKLLALFQDIVRSSSPA
jgi:glycosyltransferase involved in cell wall biosynthesis